MYQGASKHIQRQVRDTAQQSVRQCAARRARLTILRLCTPGSQLLAIIQANNGSARFLTSSSPSSIIYTRKSQTMDSQTANLVRTTGAKYDAGPSWEVLFFEPHLPNCLCLEVDRRIQSKGRLCSRTALLLYVCMPNTGNVVNQNRMGKSRWNVVEIQKIYRTFPKEFRLFDGFL